MWTVRMWVPDRKGLVDLHLANPDINLTSVVHISVSEATDRSDSVILGTLQDFRPHLGQASITLQNVAVRNGGVDFRVFIDFKSPINIVADITIDNDPPSVVWGE